MHTTDLVNKYNVAGPRYTSYPTVPYWDNNSIDANKWKNAVKQSFSIWGKEEGISLYIHLPFCEMLCFYCACNTFITKMHNKELPYIESVLHEWNSYVALFNEKPLIREIHLGGGTPTFFSPQNLQFLIEGIFGNARKASNIKMSFEAHPGNTTDEHLTCLAALGFTRLSIGVQDFDLKVQKAINRPQDLQSTARLVEKARGLGYTSINMDLVYGLPHQTKESLSDTLQKVLLMKPDRIAFYSYAHVPWLRPAQLSFEKFLPTSKQKNELYVLAKSMLSVNNYHDIGMDHFALVHDDMYKAFKNKNLHRNFMGYTTTNTHMLIGLGVSSISDVWTAFSQNPKDIKPYEMLVKEKGIPHTKGHLLSKQDLSVRKIILDLMCHFEADFSDKTEFLEDEVEAAIERLHEMEQDGLVRFLSNKIEVNDSGKAFVRNICMALDLRMLANKPETQLFSMTV
jgi:oxygen-independent coproporphyrinogen-3 oxidase